MKLPAAQQLLRRAFARQALSDFAVYDLLKRAPEVERSHSLHYLQMAAEKACKAYLYSLQRGDLEYILDHNVVEKVVSLCLRQPQYRRYSGTLRRQIRTHAYQVDRLAPAVDRLARPDNCEYPWIAANGQVRLPCEYPFPELADQDRSFLQTIKVLQNVAQQMVQVI